MPTVAYIMLLHGYLYGIYVPQMICVPFVALSSLMPYHLVCSKSNMMGVTCGAVTATFSGTLEFIRMLLNLLYSVECFADHCLSLCLFSFIIVYIRGFSHPMSFFIFLIISTNTMYYNTSLIMCVVFF